MTPPVATEFSRGCNTTVTSADQNQMENTLKRTLLQGFGWLLAGLLIFGAAGCSSSASGGTKSTEPLLINGAGSTFGYPIYSRWESDFHQLYPDVNLNYQSVGSGAGIQQLLAGTVDFGASDAPMTNAQLAQAKSPVLHFPTVLGAVVPFYNLPGISASLNFTPAALAGIYLGKITKWNDAALTAVNRGIKLPNTPIVVVHRSEGSGTTFIWTDYLSKVSPEWKSRVGASTSVNWPVGLGAKGSEAVTGLVEQTPNAIGYVELTYAIQNKIAFGAVQNAAGKFVQASLPSVTAAAASAQMPPDFRVSITNPPGADAYPIASFTWLLVPTQIPDPAKRQALTEFLHWMLGPGQQAAAPLAYAPLPAAVSAQEATTIAQIH